MCAPLTLPGDTEIFFAVGCHRSRGRDIQCLMGTPETSAASTSNSAPRRAAALDRARAELFDPALACALLHGPDLDAGLRYVLQGLDDEPPGAHAAWLELVALLSQIPFVASSRARRRGYAADPDTLDLLVGDAPAPDATHFGVGGREWLATNSAMARALRRRTEWLTRQIERAAQDQPSARIVGLNAGAAHELFASEAVRGGTACATLVEYDAQAVDALRARARTIAPQVDVQRASLADVLGGECRLFDCALVYAPSLASHLPLSTVRDLIDALLLWLRPGGRLVLPVHTTLGERGFLEHVAEWRPNVVVPERLLQGTATRRGIAARVEHDHACGLAYVDLTRLH